MVKLKRQKKMLYSKQFFKVFLPHQSSSSLKFPLAFIKYLNSSIPFKSTVITRNKSSWEVHVEKIDDNLYFNKGWEQFVTQNSLEFGDFLVFSYDGNKMFRVKIYGPNGCEKVSTYHHVESYGVLTLLDENPIDETRKSKGLDYVASEFESDFPSFKVVMKPSYLTHRYMGVPLSFAKKHMEKDEECVKQLKLVYCNKSWLVKSIRVREGYWRFSRGWFEFLRDNDLKKGDVCVFKLVGENDYIFDVSILKC